MGFLPLCKIYGEHQYHDVSMMSRIPCEVTVKCFRCGERTIVFDDAEDAKVFFRAVSQTIMRQMQKYHDDVKDILQEHDKP